MVSNSAKRCKWNFAFTLKFKDEADGKDGATKGYELYSPTRIDRAQWVKILSTIAEMNRQNVCIDQITPFDYIQEQEQLKQCLQDQDSQINSSNVQELQEETKA